MSASIVAELDPEHAAKEARLRYVSDDIPGYRRRRYGKGFSYYDSTGTGRAIRDPTLRAWMQALAIPPAWEQVWVSPYRNSHILATGRDEKGRKQYIYHPRWTALRAESNFQQLLTFGEVLPALRQRIDADLRRPGLQRERVLALVVHLLDETLIRVGNSEYAERNRSYGLTTLRSRHLGLAGGRIHLEFRGKSGKLHSTDIQDRRIARIIRRCQELPGQELPGQELFQYLDEAGQRRSIDSADVNDYLSTATGQPLTAKMFRTWGGSVADGRSAAGAAAAAERSGSRTQYSPGHQGCVAAADEHRCRLSATLCPPPDRPALSGRRFLRPLPGGCFQ